MATYSEERRRKISEATKAAMARPEVKAKVSAGLKKFYASCDKSVQFAFMKDPEYIAKRSKQSKELYNDEAFRKKHSDATKAAMRKPEIKEKHRQAVKKFMNDPSHKALMHEIHTSDEYIQKSIDTKRKNGTLNTSRQEKEILAKLKSLFVDVKDNYRSKQYPYKCDFYVPELDLYIEFQGIWTHGGMPFDENNEKCMLQLEYFKNHDKELSDKGRVHNMYKNAIETWTIRDVKKRNTAKMNNLNWLEFFSMQEFDEWLNSIKKAGIVK